MLIYIEYEGGIGDQDQFEGVNYSVNETDNDQDIDIIQDTASLPLRLLAPPDREDIVEPDYTNIPIDLYPRV